MDKEKYIVHICTRKDWQEAQAAGQYQPPSLKNEGFIHCSRPNQAITVVNRFYRQVPELILLWINPELIDAEIRWEAADGEVFPHIYGPLAINAVLTVRNILPDPDGEYRTEPKL